MHSSTESAHAAETFLHIMKERRTTRHFSSEPVDNEDLQHMLRMAALAPSGYNFQPWRFVVVRDPANRARLRKTALNQGKAGEAPVVIVAFGRRDSWSEYADQIFQTAARNGARPKRSLDRQRDRAIGVVQGQPIANWLNRHVMTAFTHLMLAAESLGWDTALLEGFDPSAVGKSVGLPEDAEVVALLAIGRRRDRAPPFPGRLSVSKFVYAETFGRMWSDTTVHL